MRHILLALVLALPFSITAAELPAGFPSQPIWLSSSSATAGEKITIYAALYNESASPISGVLSFTVDGKEVKSQAFELGAGKSDIYSAVWTATAGEHSISAQIRDASDTKLKQNVTVEAAASPRRAIRVAPAPPSETEQAVSTVKDTVNLFIGSSTPIVGPIVSAVLSVTEPVREAGVAKLEKFLEKKSATTAQPSEVMNVAPKEETGAGAAVSRASQVAAAAALFTMKSMWLFYPLAMFFILGTLYYTGRKLARGRRG